MNLSPNTSCINTHYYAVQRLGVKTINQYAALGIISKRCRQSTLFQNSLISKLTNPTSFPYPPIPVPGVMGESASKIAPKVLPLNPPVDLPNAPLLAVRDVEPS